MLCKFRPRMESLMRGVQSPVTRPSQNYKCVLSPKAYSQCEAMLTRLLPSLPLSSFIHLHLMVEKTRLVI